jgi:hypothetical protein
MCAAPAGNNFWEKRSQHGRKKIFTDPETMLKACYEYFTYQTNDRIWLKKEAVKGGEFTGQIIDVPTATPFSIEGLCLFLDVNTKYFNHFESALKPKENKIDEDFSNVITRVRDIIATQQLEGATVGAFNANIVARRLGLADKMNNDISFDRMTDKQLDEALDKLKEIAIKQKK